jgi:hypothetical protein
MWCWCGCWCSCYRLRGYRETETEGLWAQALRRFARPPKQVGKAAATVVGPWMVGSPEEVREVVREVVQGEASVAERNLLAARGVVSAAARNPVVELVVAGSRVVVVEEAVAGASYPFRVPASLWSAHYQAAHHRYH